MDGPTKLRGEGGAAATRCTEASGLVQRKVRTRVFLVTFVGFYRVLAVCFFGISCMQRALVDATV